MFANLQTAAGNDPARMLELTRQFATFRTVGDNITVHSLLVTQEWSDEVAEIVGWTDILADNFVDQFWYINAINRRDFILIDGDVTLTAGEITKIKKFCKIPYTGVCS